jgi:hypothetical protein
MAAACDNWDFYQWQHRPGSACDGLVKQREFAGLQFALLHWFDWHFQATGWWQRHAFLEHPAYAAAAPAGAALMCDLLNKQVASTVVGWSPGGQVQPVEAGCVEQPV